MDCSCRPTKTFTALAFKPKWPIQGGKVNPHNCAIEWAWKERQACNQWQWHGCATQTFPGWFSSSGQSLQITSSPTPVWFIIVSWVIWSAAELLLYLAVSDILFTVTDIKRIDKLLPTPLTITVAYNGIRNCSPKKKMELYSVTSKLFKVRWSFFINKLILVLHTKTAL